MKVLDLFAGLKGWSQPFTDRGHEVLTLDYLPHFKCDYTVDILEWDIASLPWKPDVILASPPCEGFSVMQIGRNWTAPYDDPPHAPKTNEARHALLLVERTVDLIALLEPRFYIIENPRAKLRKLSIVQQFDHRTVSYCHYGEQRAKPTDLWGGFPPSLNLSPECHNQRPDHPDDCCCRDHISAVRGSVTGTQGMDREQSAKIPYPLAMAICLAMEVDYDF